MASYEKLHDSELEAGRTMDLDNNTVLVVDEKRQDEEPSTSEDSSRRTMSPLKRAFAVVFIFAFIGFSLLRGVALVSVHCISSKYSQLGNHPELMEDEAFTEALRSISPEEYCKLYAEYCPDKNEPPMDTWEPIPAMDEVAVELSDAEPAIEASLDKRQDTGNNSTVTQPPTSDSSSSSSGPTSSPTTSDDDDGETTTSSQPPPPPPVTTTTTTEAPPPPPSTTTTTSSSTEDDDDESSTTTQGPTSVPTSTSEVESTSTTSERPTSAEDDETSSTPRSSSSRRTVTSGTITTTSAERHTITSTLPDGEATTITSTTWVEFVPEETAQSENDPNLQGSASGWERSTHLQVVMGVFVGGLLMI